MSSILYALTHSPSSGMGAGPCLGPLAMGHMASTCAEYVIIFSPLPLVGAPAQTDACQPLDGVGGFCERIHSQFYYKAIFDIFQGVASTSCRQLLQFLLTRVHHAAFVSGQYWSMRAARIST